MRGHPAGPADLPAGAGGRAGRRGGRDRARGEGVGRSCLNSFAAKTPVALADGTTKSIAGVAVIDEVLAYDEDTGQIVPRRVTDLIAHDDPGVVALMLGGEHPFLTQKRGWVGAGQLQRGEHVRTAAGRWGVVGDVSLRPSPRRMYNLTVEGAHTFFVGDGRWLVHNMCAMLPRGALSSEERALADMINDLTNRGRKPLGRDDAEAVLDLAGELNWPGRRADTEDLATPNHWAGGPHIHLPGVGPRHIPVAPGVGPRPRHWR